MEISREDPTNSRIDKFLFQPVDATAAAWLRIAFAIAIPYFFWSVGQLPKSSTPEILQLLYETVILTPGHRILMVSLCILLGIGWRPRLCGFVLAPLLFPLCFLPAGHVSRQVILVALVLFSFIPSGVARKPWQTNRENLNASSGPCWPVRLLQIHLTLIYGANALAKSSEIYLRGEALMDMSLVLWNFKVDLSSGYLTAGSLAIPVALVAVSSTLTEYLLAFGFWVRRFRWLIAIVGIGFHYVLDHVVGIYKLHHATIFLYLVFLLPLIPAENDSK